MHVNETSMDKKSKIYVAGHKGLVGSAIWKNSTSSPVMI